MLKRIGVVEAAPPWGILTAVSSIAAAFLMIVLGSAVVSLIFGNTPAATVTGWTVGTLLMVVFVSFTRSQEREALRLNPGKTALPLVVLTGVAFALLVDLLSLAVTQVALPPVELLSFFSGFNVTVPQVTAITWLLAFIFMAAAQPVGEELIFRGVVFPSFRSTFGAWPGLIFCALAYALFHLLAYSPSSANSDVLWYAFAVPFIEGFYISAVRAYTGSTRAAMAAHFAIGALGVLRALVLAG